MLVLPSLILAWIFTHKLQNVLYQPHTIILGVSIFVMLIQAFVWRTIWRRYFNKQIEHHMRSIAFYAYMMSLILTVMGIGSLLTEIGHDKASEYRASKQKIAVQRHLDLAGFRQYESAEFPYGSHPVHNFDTSYGESMVYQFRTPDNGNQVYNFYRDIAEQDGLRIFGALSLTDGRPVIGIVGEDNHVTILRNWRDGYWMATVYYELSDISRAIILREVVGQDTESSPEEDESR